MRNNLSVRTKITICFLMVSLITLCLGVSSLLNLRKVNNNSDLLYNNSLMSISKLSSIKDSVNQCYTNLLIMSSSEDSISQKYYNDQFNRSFSNLSDLIKSFSNSNYALTKSEETYWNIVKQAFDTLSNSSKELSDAFSKEDPTLISASISQITSNNTSLTSNLNHLISIKNESAKASFQNSVKIYDNAVKIMYIIVGLCLVVSTILGMVLSRSITRGLKKCVNFAEKLSSGDLTHKINVQGSDEIAKLSKALDSSTDNLNSMVETIIDGSNELSASAEELTATVEEISSQLNTINESSSVIAKYSDDSNSNVTNIVATLDSLNKNIENLSIKANESSSLSQNIKVKAMDMNMKGQESLNKTQMLYKEKELKLKEAINQAKVIDQIKSLTDIISSIAAETNLLALNAAIESARAGEHGRGFAVVAEEVRKLSEETSRTAKDIHGIIEKVNLAFNQFKKTTEDILTFMTNDVTSQFNVFLDNNMKYNEDAEFITSLSETISKMSSDLYNTISSVNSSISSLAASSQNTASGSSEILSSVSDASYAIENIAHAAQEQAVLAQNLTIAISKFKVR